MAEQKNEHFQPDEQQKLSPGVLLKVARETKKISLSEAANELRLTTQRLSDIENDEFSNMGAETFAKGYLRSYARFLGVPEEQVLEAFENSGFGSSIASYKPQLLHERITENTGGRGSRRLGYLILLILAILAAFWWQNRASISGFQDIKASSAPQNITDVPPAPAQTEVNSPDQPVPTVAPEGAVFPVQDPSMSLIKEPKPSSTTETPAPSVTPQAAPNINVNLE